MSDALPADVELRDALFAAAYAPGQTTELRKEKLREVAELCEKKLGDMAGAAKALKSLLALDPSDRSTRRSLADLLESSEQWTDFALLLEREANIEVDVDKKVAMLRHLASVHETKRGDHRGAAEALACVANLVPATPGTIAEAASAFERADAIDEAADVIDGNVTWVDDLAVRTELLERLGALRERLSDPRGAGAAYSRAAEATDRCSSAELPELPIDEAPPEAAEPSRPDAAPPETKREPRVRRRTAPPPLPT